MSARRARDRRALAVLLVSVVVTGAWAGGLVTTTSTGPVGRAPVAVALATGPMTTDALPIPAGASVTPLAASYPLDLSFTLTPRDPSALARFVASVNDPASPLYRHFLTQAEYEHEYAPSPASVAVVTQALRAAGATSVTVTADRNGVLATMSTGAVEALLGVHLVALAHARSVPLYTSTGTPRLPRGLAGTVAAVNGLSDLGSGRLSFNLRASALRPVRQLASAPSFVHDNRTQSDWFVGSDYTQAYNATDLFPGGSVANATFPTGVAIATLLAGGYNTTLQQDLPAFDPAVVDAYFNATFPTNWPAPSIHGVPVTIGTVTPPPPGPFGSLNDSTLDEFENSLDLEMAGSLAPGASVYNFYFAGSLLAQAPNAQSIAGYFAATLSSALAQNYSPEHLGVVTGSFGLPDLNNSLWNADLLEASAMGVTVTIASGDQGNAPDSLTGRGTGPWPTWPGTAATNVSGPIAVGGVSLSLGGSPTGFYGNNSLNLSFDSNVTGIAGQTAWYDAPPGASTIAGTEGGASTVTPEPYWQLHSAAQPAIVNATALQGASSLGRAEPDLAMAGNSTIATVLANATGTIFFAVLEGTSIASPVLAGLLADVIAVESARNATGWAPLGFLDPEIYRIASYYAAFPDPARDPFLGVTTGHNYVFSASPGWDPLTGWGGIDAPLFLAADENATVRSYQYVGPIPGLPVPASTPSPSVPWLVIFAIFGVGLVAGIVLIVLMLRPSRRTGPSMIPAGVHGLPGAPYGPGVQGGIYPGATFLCPYCGAVRPAEAGRCPGCGAP